MCALNVRSGKAPFDGGKVFPGCGRELELAILGAFNYVDIGVLQNEESACSMALRLLKPVRLSAQTFFDTAKRRLEQTGHDIPWAHARHACAQRR